MKPRVTVTCTVDVEMGEALLNAAIKRNVSLAEFNRQVLREYMADQVKAAQAAVQRATTTAAKAADDA
ncbi:MAG TPA: hypothetical protein VF916_13065, partial [Ktedonobacterales bacterium]